MTSSVKGHAGLGQFIVLDVFLLQAVMQRRKALHEAHWQPTVPDSGVYLGARRLRPTYSSEGDFQDHEGRIYNA